MSSERAFPEPELPHVHVVLARPSEARNIGAACRAIANFGIHRLTIVTETPIDYEAARPLAVAAAPLLEAARVVPTLSEAVADDALVAGITRRLGQKRKSTAFTPRELAIRALDERASIAVVFGNEQHGLSDEELLSCHIAVAIPTSPTVPSLNLSHAVGVICYELFQARRDARRGALGNADRDDADLAPEGPAVRPLHPGAGTLPTAADLDAASARMIASLEALGFHSQDGPQGMRLFLRDLCARAGTSTSEARRLEELFAKLAGMHGRT